MRGRDATDVRAMATLLLLSSTPCRGVSRFVGVGKQGGEAWFRVHLSPSFRAKFRRGTSQSERGARV